MSTVATEGAAAAVAPPADSLSRGPTELLPVPLARKCVLSFAGPLDSVSVDLRAGLGRVLATDLLAPADSPAADLSAVDGFAVTEAAPLPVGARRRIVGEAAAGRPYLGAQAPGAAVRVFTGAVLPPGARRVLKAEGVHEHAGILSVLAPEAAPHVRRRGENYRAGAVLLRAGCSLGPTEISLAAAAGASTVRVHRAPRIAHLITGSELVTPGVAAAPGQIHDANGPLVASLAAQCGATLVEQRIVADRLAECCAAAAALPDHDVLLVSGGAGEGRYDFARPLLHTLGFDVHFRSVKVRPGKPLGFATRGATLAFALPGNPVSHWATWHLFVAPALRRLAGEPIEAAIPLRRGALASVWDNARDDRQVFWPARAAWHADEWRVQPCRFLNSGDLAGIAGANALLHAADLAPLPPGAAVEFVPCP